MVMDLTPDLPAPDGYEWVEVGAYASNLFSPDCPRVLAWRHEAGWWDGHPYGSICRGDHPLEEKRCAWERMYVLRRLQ